METNNSKENLPPCICLNLKYAKPHPLPVEVIYSGFWRRFSAWVIDYIFILFCMFILAFFLVLFLGIFGLIDIETTPEEKLGNLFQFLGNIISFPFTWIYYALMESSSKQATLGKLAIGIKVTDENGNRITFGRASGRFFAKILSGLTLGIGYLMIAFTEKKQGMHDLLAKCLVVNKN